MTLRLIEASDLTSENKQLAKFFTIQELERDARMREPDRPLEQRAVERAPAVL